MHVLLATILILTLGCDDPKPEPDVALAQAPAASKPPLAKTETTPAPILEYGPVQPQNPIRWFKGVSQLPENHPCHDKATVVTVDWGCQEANVSLATLGELRQSPDTDWVHFGPRTVRGAAWSDADGEHMVVSCDLRGVGFRAANKADRQEFADAELDQNLIANAAFRLGDCGECSAVEVTFVHWMSKPKESFPRIR